MHKFSLSSLDDDDFEITIESETDFGGNSLITIVIVLLLYYCVILFLCCNIDNIA